jgi:hypothetical protein
MISINTHCRQNAFLLYINLSGTYIDHRDIKCNHNLFSGTESIKHLRSNSLSKQAEIVIMGEEINNMSNHSEISGTCPIIRQIPQLPSSG